MITPFAEDVVLVSTRAKRIENAKQFLKDNLIEIIACAREKNEAEKTSVSRRERHNKILQLHEVMKRYHDKSMSDDVLCVF
jgi:inosine/xanthosine triphosphate pyrophosphatase family protein